MPSRVLVPASCLPPDGSGTLITSKGSGNTQSVDSLDGPRRIPPSTVQGRRSGRARKPPAKVRANEASAAKSSAARASTARLQVISKPAAQSRTLVSSWEDHDRVPDC